MLSHPLENLLFVDIETVSQYPGFENLSEEWKQLWTAKVERQLSDEESVADFYSKRAAIMAEFGKIVCISVGYFINENNTLRFRVKSFYDHNETTLLATVINAFNQWQANRKNATFCGHNIREFDIPYLCRRLLVNNIAIPPYLDFQSMKPWETNIVDTFQLWKFGDFKNYTSLNLLAACLHISSPKEDIDGSQVGDVYWKDKDLKRIASYCARDVITVAQLILRFRQMPLLPDAAISIV